MQKISLLLIILLIIFIGISFLITKFAPFDTSWDPLQIEKDLSQSPNPLKEVEKQLPDLLKHFRNNWEPPLKADNVDSILVNRKFLTADDSVWLAKLSGQTAGEELFSHENLIRPEIMYMRLLNEIAYRQYRKAFSPDTQRYFFQRTKLLATRLDSVLNGNFHIREYEFYTTLEANQYREKLTAEYLLLQAHLNMLQKHYFDSAVFAAYAHDIAERLNDDRIIYECLTLIHYVILEIYGLTNTAFAISDFLDARFSDYGHLLNDIRAKFYQGHILIDKGAFEQATMAYEGALGIARRINHKGWFPQIYERLAIAERRTGNYDKAREYYNTILKSENGELREIDQVQCLIGLGLIDFESGEYQHAIQKYKQARKLAEPIDDPNVIVALTNLAEVYTVLGDYLKASEYQKEALQKAIVFQSPQTTTFSWSHLAEIYLMAGNISQAKVALDSARDMLSIHNFGILEADVETNLGRINLKIGNNKSALLSFQQALQEYQKLGFPRDQFRLYNLIGETYRRLGNHEEASKALRRAAELAQRYAELGEKWQTYHYLSLLARDSGDRQRADRHLLTSIAELKKIINNVAAPHDRSSFSAKIQPVFEDMVSLQIAQNRPAEAFRYSEMERAQALRLLLHRTRADTLVQNIGSSAGQAIDVRQDFITRLHAALADSVLVLKYEVTDNSLILWGVTKDTLQVATGRLSRRSLDSLVQEFRTSVDPESIKTDFAGTYLKSRETGRELYQILIQPLEKMLDRAALVHIVPDEALNYVPFAALLTAEQYFIEKYATVQHPSAAILYDLLNKKSGMPKHPISLLAIAAESGLTHAIREARQTARLTPGSTVLTGSAASEAGVVTAINSQHYDAILFSSHGNIDERRPDFSHIVLSKPGSPQGEFDGKLTYPEITKLNCDSTTVVFLSACETGSGKLYRGEGMVGLQRAFMIAGAQSVIANLWKIDQLSSKDLTVAFFNTWIKKKCTKIHALRESQLNMLRSLRTSRAYNRMPHPFFWAPVVLSGDDN